MAIDGKILAKARKILQDRRNRKEETLDKRLREVYAKSQMTVEIDAKLRMSMAQLIGATLDKNSQLTIDEIRKANLSLQEQRKKEIKRAGFDENYLDDNYMCQNCRDTGYVNGVICRCLETIYQKEQSISLSNLFKLGNEKFENFRLQLYDDKPLAEAGISPRTSMNIVFEACKEYAYNFDEKSRNLLLLGKPGLGKTYLSACIARVVAEKGFSVVYDMATVIFSKYEDAKFSRVENIDEIREEIKRYLECDLLILDDLGTEMTTTFTTSALYEIINTRLVTGKKTIINSNMTSNELMRRYSDQIASRLGGEYLILNFYGDDIRQKLNVI